MRTVGSTDPEGPLIKLLSRTLILSTCAGYCGRVSSGSSQSSTILGVMMKEVGSEEGANMPLS